jgi:hypothetical protein
MLRCEQSEEIYLYSSVLGFVYEACPLGHRYFQISVSDSGGEPLDTPVLWGDCSERYR